MTVNDLYALSKQLMFEPNSSTAYDENIIANVNVVLNELFAENNVCREFYGKAPFIAIPYVQNRTDTIYLEDEYAYQVAPIGLASRLALDVDGGIHSTLLAQYNNARVMHQKMIVGD